MQNLNTSLLNTTLTFILRALGGGNISDLACEHSIALGWNIPGTHRDGAETMFKLRINLPSHCKITSPTNSLLTNQTLVPTICYRENRLLTSHWIICGYI